MPLKKKKPAENMEVESEESDDSNDSDGDSEDYQGNEEIQVDFEGRNAIDSDFHGIRQLLKQLFLKAHINLSELTDLIIGQNYIGSVVTQADISEDEEDDDDDDDMNDSNMVFGITTAINISHKADNGCKHEIRSYILDKAQQHASDSVLKVFKDALTNPAKTVGFLISERFVNIPPQISVPLLENLYKEIQRATKKGMPFKFVHFLMIIKFHRKTGKNNKSDEDILSNEEEELFSTESFASFEYSVKNEIDSGVAGDCLEESNSRLTPYRKMVLFDSHKLPHIINSIKQLIDQ